MNNSVPDFYLASSEGYNMEEPKKCYRVKRLRGEHRDDYLLIKVDPPFIGQKFGLGGQDVDKVIVATRHKGASLFPIREWPVFVHVARVLVSHPENREFLHEEDLEEFAWAELYETELAADRKEM